MNLAPTSYIYKIEEECKFILIEMSEHQERNKKRDKVQSVEI
jgi:hypothetical protein